MDRTEKLLDKLETSIKDGDLYSALQLYRTQHARALKKGNHEMAVNLAYKGSKLMLEHGHTNAGSDLGKLLIETWDELNVEACGEPIDKINQLIGLFPHDDTENREINNTKLQFLRAALEWSKNKGRFQFGEPSIRKAMAETLVENGNFTEAMQHFVHAYAPIDFAKFLRLWTESGVRFAGKNSKEERDLLLAQAILHLLAQQNIRDAKIVYDEYLKFYPDLQTPLTRFLNFLMEALRRDAYPLFQALRKHYHKTIERGNDLNPPLSMQLDRIAQKFYKVNMPRPQMANMMENMMKLMGGMNQ